MMATSAKTGAPRSIWNVPNQITAMRFLLSIGVFALIGLHLDLAALILFLLAASTDWMDGYWARRYNQVTKLGRVFDPFVDKMIICGAFVFLASRDESGIAAWMAVLVMGREMLVTSLRSFIEQSGGDFSANFSGKLKMVLQCAAVSASLLGMWLGSTSWLPPLRTALIYAAIISTVQSGLVYCQASAAYLRES